MRAGRAGGGAERGRGRRLSRPCPAFPPHPKAAATVAAQGGREAVCSICGSPRRPLAEAHPRRARARARQAARGAAARGPRKVPSASAEMPGSDTALTVDRTYSDPGRHHRCKSRVRGARGVAVGAPGRGARPGGLGLPRERRRPARFSASLPLFPAAPSPGFPAQFELTGLGSGEWEPGPRFRDPRSPSRAGVAQSTARRPLPLVGPSTPGSPRRPALRRPLCQVAPAARWGTRGDPAIRGTVFAEDGLLPSL